MTKAFQSMTWEKAGANLARIAIELSNMINSLISPLSEEDLRLARLKTFCAAIGMDFFAAREIINMVYRNTCLPIEEIQSRFFFCKNYGINLYLGTPCFWDVALLEERNFKHSRV